MRWALLILALCLAGCAGARASVVAPSVRYPVSLSQGMRGPDGHLLSADEMKSVGHFHDERTAWGLVYSLVPLTPHLDESDALNRQIAAAKGDAVIGLTTKSKTCALDWFFGFNFLPIWPGCARIVLDGEIVRYQPLAPSAGSQPAASKPKAAVAAGH